MIKKLTAVAGFGAGYVLGAKAGHERYRQIVRKVDELRGRPAVQHATDVVTSAVADKASDLASAAATGAEQVVSGAVDSAKAKVGKSPTAAQGATP